MFYTFIGIPVMFWAVIACIAGNTVATLLVIVLVIAFAS